MLHSSASGLFLFKLFGFIRFKYGGVEPKQFPSTQLPELTAAVISALTDMASISLLIVSHSREA